MLGSAMANAKVNSSIITQSVSGVTCKLHVFTETKKGFDHEDDSGLLMMELSSSTTAIGLSGWTFFAVTYQFFFAWYIIHLIV